MQVLQNQGEGHHHFVWPEQQGTQKRLKKEKKVITIWPEQQETHKSHGGKKKKQHG